MQASLEAEARSKAEALRIKKKLESPLEINTSSEDELKRPRLDPKKIKRIRNDVTFNYSKTDFKFEE